MKKTYRISVFNRTTGKRELIYTAYTSKKAAQAMADEMNKVDLAGVVDAIVITK